MNRIFFQELMSRIMDQGRDIIASDTRKSRKPRDMVELAQIVLSERGEASGIALARELLDTFFAADEADRTKFFGELAKRFGPDKSVLAEAIKHYLTHPDDDAAAKLHDAAEPLRQELIRRLNRAPHGTSSLVALRENLLAKLPNRGDLKIIDRDFSHLFESWFNRGFLVLERIDWSSPASILEKIIRYEAVHAITGWNDLRRRIDIGDRRCYAFFHPAMVDEPLIFVEIALTRGMPDAIAPILSKERDPISADDADTAVFYSISNCQKGLKGVSFGNFLIKQVVEELARELPHLKTFVTLSPVPGLTGWLKQIVRDEAGSILSAQHRAALLQLIETDWRDNSETLEQARDIMLPLAAYYLLNAKHRSGNPFDPVARFHLGNGARLERINWFGDISQKGLSQSAGIMVNYLYDLPKIESNHEAYANSHKVMAASAVTRLAKHLPPQKALVLSDE